MRASDLSARAVGVEGVVTVTREGNTIPVTRGESLYKSDRIKTEENASIELKNQLLKITTWKGIHTVTQFRIRHVISFSNAWELKKSWQKSKALIFLAIS